MPSILPLVQLGINYITYIFASQKINWSFVNETDSTPFLPEAQRNILLENKTLLTFSDGNAGILAPSFFFLPAYLNLDTQEKNTEYYSQLSDAVASENWSELENRYQSELKHIREFYPNFLTEIDNSKPGVYLADIVKDIGMVFMTNFTEYTTKHWEQEKAYLERIAKLIPSLWEGVDIISIWEKKTGLCFSAENYKILLVSAMQNGPNANSLAYDTNTFSAGDGADMLYYYKHFISHEIGTHLVLPYTVSKMTNPDTVYQAYIAMENLAAYINNQLFQFTEYSIFDEEYYHYNYFQTLYTKLQKKHPNSDVIMLFEMALKQAVSDGISNK